MDTKEKLPKPSIKQWPTDADVEKELLKRKEKFIVLRSCRINLLDGEGAKSYRRGDPVELNGDIKKDLYFQNKIVYPADFEKIDAYEKQEGIKGAMYSAAPVPEPAGKELKKLLKENADLKAELSETKAVILDLHERIKALEEKK